MGIMLKEFLCPVCDSHNVEITDIDVDEAKCLCHDCGEEYVVIIDSIVVFLMGGDGEK